MLDAADRVFVWILWIGLAVIVGGFVWMFGSYNITTTRDRTELMKKMEQAELQLRSDVNSTVAPDRDNNAALRPAVDRLSAEYDWFYFWRFHMTLSQIGRDPDAEEFLADTSLMSNDERRKMLWPQLYGKYAEIELAYRNDPDSLIAPAHDQMRLYFIEASSREIADLAWRMWWK